MATGLVCTAGGLDPPNPKTQPDYFSILFYLILFYSIPVNVLAVKKRNKKGKIGITFTKYTLTTQRHV